MRQRFPICPISELLPGQSRLVQVNGVEVGVFNLGDAVVAYRNHCPHQGAPVCRGRVGGTTLPSAPGEYIYGWQGRVLHCPWHGWHFDLASGKAIAHRARLSRVETAVEGEVLIIYL